MNNRITINFIRDKMFLAICFFINSFIITLFYSLSTQEKIDLFYPFLMSLSIFCFIFLLQWHKYYLFNNNLSKLYDNPYFDLKPITLEQEDINKIIVSIHEKYLAELHTLQSENLENRHFISQWIHNIKTPVSIIDLIIQKEFKNNEILPKTLKDIYIENDKIQNLLEQILSMARLEEFTKDYSLSEVDLISSIKKTVNNKKSLFIYSNVFPKLQYSQKELYIHTDSKWNEFLIEQIISNAIKYSNVIEKSKNIYFIIEKGPQNISLTIKDEGVGIPQHDINRVFEPFFTGENGRKFKNLSSSGIGLHICKTIADKLGHNIALQSQYGQGTAVTINYLSKPKAF